MQLIDLRSDTLTKPSDEMRQAISQAVVGDDVYGEDPTVKELEQMMATKMGMEAGLFVTSGTQGNLVALLTHCPRGREVILEADAHIFYYEVGGLSVTGGLIPVLVPGTHGVLDPEAVRQRIRPQNVHYPETGLVCMENTHNRAGGTVTRPAQARAIVELAHAHGIPVHVDGARIFNAAVALGVQPSELLPGVDSVSICLSKGLGAPVGSVICGSRDFIEAARKYRKLLGGGLRQAGILAAAGIYALQHNVERLAEDHQHAQILATGVSEISGLAVDMATVETNIVAVQVVDGRHNAAELVERLAAVGVLAGASSAKTVRLVTHLNVSREDCQEALRRIRTAVAW